MISELLCTNTFSTDMGNGGSVYVYNTSGSQNAIVKLQNNTVDAGTLASVNGAGFYFTNGDSLISANNYFSNLIAENYGGAIYCNNFQKTACLTMIA